MPNLSSFRIRIPTKLVSRFKPLLPRSLFGRTLLIIVVPMLITLAAATFVFFDRHWFTVTNRMTYAVAGDVAMVVELMRVSPTSESTAALIKLAADKMDMRVSFIPDKRLSKTAKDTLNPLWNILRHALDDKISYPFDIDMHYAMEMVAVRVGTPEGIYTALIPQRRIYTPTTQVFIIWMVTSSILLSAVALLFMRNQIRPIRRLAEAAEAIGKGRDVPWFKIEGAAEVRQAAAALMVMRDRLQRQINQRTGMLAGVSHDLRTPLTRMKLQLELMPSSQEVKDLSLDIAEMEAMLEAYLAFARGEDAETGVLTDMRDFLGEIVAAAGRQNFGILCDVASDVVVTIRRNAMKRCLNNLIGNAMRYAKHVRISVAVRDHVVNIMIDDDGAGIPAHRREDVFRPFTRLDESRNSATGGVGLGLTIARDIARFHGGDVLLEDSPMGGLRARVWLPI